MVFCNSSMLHCFPITQLKYICLKHMSNLFSYLRVVRYGNPHQFSQLKNPHWSLHIKGLKTWSLGSSSLLAAEAHSKHSFTRDEANPLSESKQGVLHFIQQNKHAQNNNRTYQNKIMSSNPREGFTEISAEYIGTLKMLNWPKHTKQHDTNTGWGLKWQATALLNTHMK